VFSRPRSLSIVALLSAAVAQRSLAADGPVAPQATDPAIIVNAQARVALSLDGPWHVIVDPYENGYYDYRYQPHANGYFRNEKPRAPSDRIEYDFDASETLEVPGDWNSQRERLFLYEGTVWYQRRFRHQIRPGRRAFLYFGAAANRAIVYLNGERLGDHEGGFTPFSFEVTGRLRAGDNVVIVKVDNTRRRAAVPTVNTDWWNYGGLTREVLLLEAAATFVRDVTIGLDRAAPDRVSGWVQLDGARRQQKLSIEIPEARIRHAVTTDAAGRAAFSFPAPGLARWSPTHPKLYDVVVRAEDDSFADKVGFRTIEARGGDILLNGRPVFLRGISLHEEAPARGGRAHRREDAETLLRWAKELGCNFVRLAHYPHNEGMVRAADRMGLLVWSEIPVYWTITWEDPATLANARAQLAESITRDRNRAAIVLWSVANETPVSPARDRFLRELIALARRLDDRRLVTAALEHRYLDGGTVIIDDPLGADLDVIGANEYIGWYDGLPEKCDRITWRTAHAKPHVISEFGGDALFGHHGDAGARWTEEFQERLYQRQIAMLRRIPFLRGTSPWILVDFRSPRRHLPRIQDFWNRKGLVTTRGEKKKAFFVLQSYYRQLAGAEGNDR
jgi:beta-glucuronidase